MHKYWNLLKPGLLVMLAFNPATSRALSIGNVSHMPTYVASAAVCDVKVRFNLDGAAPVSLNIYDDRGYLIKQVKSNSLKAGDNELHWNCTDFNNREVPAEAYVYTLEAGQGAKKTIFDASDLTGGEPLRIDHINWDRANGKIQYMVPKRSRVSLRAGIGDGGPLLATILDWQPRNRGAHTERWDGSATGSTVKLDEIEGAEIFVQAFSLSKNAIVVGPAQHTSKYVDISGNKLSERNKQNRSNKMYHFSAKNVQDRADYKVEMKLSDNSKKDSKGVPQVSGILPIRVSLSKRDTERMQRDRFEPMLFVDGKYVSEIESGFFPFTWRLNTDDFEPGEHYLTINIRGYDGQYGVATQKIRVVR